MSVRIIIGDCREVLRSLPAESVHCVVTSPPYWGLRDYGVAGQIGLEASPFEYIAEMVAVFRDVWRVLRSDGTLWLNLGDSYAGSGRGGNPTQETSALQGGQASQRASMVRRTRGADEVGSTARHAAVTNLGRQAIRNLPTQFAGDAESGGRIHTSYVRAPAGLKQKDLMGMPWRVAFALQADGWYLRQDIIWSKPNPMPESVRDRCTKAHEYLFLLSKSERYYFDADAIAENAVKAGLFLHSYGTGAKDRQDANDTNDRRTRIGLANWDQAQPESRNKRSVWTVSTNPFPEAHFATFPPTLIEPCVQAGSSERGCCPRCAAPWERIVAEIPTGKTHKMPDGMATYAGSHSAIHKDGREKGQPDNPVTATVTLGWYPGCDCIKAPALPAYPRKPSRAQIGDEAKYKIALRDWREACAEIDAERKRMCDAVVASPVKAATILDPFGGAGTTAVVADRLGRDATLVELNPEYAAMAERRIKGDAPLFAEVSS